ncbi:AbrB/MazE/SpoVT family DNA-binding domain-containing protein [Sphingomonas sp. 1P06PA]|uniref:AbrB/MazE/SpoVT family DNA-binding domain-containing protein n=1 Tax=Sphingomonas sp. 1P06PA TaxID=554121 RepID=UPI0039A600CF
MTKPMKLIPIGNSTGLILPKEMLARLGLSQGDAVSVVATPDGLELRRHHADFEVQMSAAREVMRARRVALREPAK